MSIPKFKNEKEEAEFWMKNILEFVMDEASTEYHPEMEISRYEKWYKKYNEIFGENNNNDLGGK